MAGESMGKSFRGILRKRYLLLLILAGLYLWGYQIAGLRSDNDELLKTFSRLAADDSVTIGYLASSHGSVRYLRMGNPHNPKLVFVHGAPASLSFWKGLLQNTSLLERYEMIAYDRPGYGYSSYGEALVDVDAQALVLSELVTELKLTAPLICGSSYGGTIATRFAMNYPKVPAGVLLVSASLQANRETIMWATYALDTKVLQYVVPKSIRVANDEKLSHATELAKMEGDWKKVEAQVSILHGEEDWLIDVSNARWAAAQLRTADTVLLNIDSTRSHDFIWNGKEQIIEQLLTYPWK